MTIRAALKLPIAFLSTESPYLLKKAVQKARRLLSIEALKGLIR